MMNLTLQLTGLEMVLRKGCSDKLAVGIEESLLVPKSDWNSTDDPPPWISIKTKQSNNNKKLGG